MFNFKFVLINVICLACAHAIISVNAETGQTINQEALQGGVARLPCNINPPNANDKVSLVMWFKDDDTKPIYTLDARSGPIDSAIHWSDSGGFRIVFVPKETPAKLRLENVQSDDAGIFKCRVDFERSPTRYSRINLTVIVPPSEMDIVDEHGYGPTNNILGPLNENASVHIACVVRGGVPPAKVTWWMDGVLIDDVIQMGPIDSNEIHVTFKIDRLQRSYLNRVFTCQAGNNDLIAPLSRSFTLDLNVAPISIQIIQETQPIVADRICEFKCEVWGARPPPNVTWWLGTAQLTNIRETIDPSGNKSTSILTFIPSSNDTNKSITCRGEHLPTGTSLADDRRLLVLYPPTVSLQLQSNDDRIQSVREGRDVYFQCNIRSNPWVHKVSWKHNGKLLHARGGIVINNQSLVVQNVQTIHSGTYVCMGTNQIGSAESNPLVLDVQFPPRCHHHQQTTYLMGLNESARILCEIDANPPATDFHWTFNHSMAGNRVVEDGRNPLMYTPLDLNDYGTLTCFGLNEVGVQTEPCVFDIVPEEMPEAVKNCAITNQTWHSIEVKCDHQQPNTQFTMEVFNCDTRKLVTNITSKYGPTFSVTELHPGITLTIFIFATNKRGAGPKTIMRVRMGEYELRNQQSVFPLVTNAGLETLLMFTLAILLVTLLILMGVVMRSCFNKKSGDSLSDHADAKRHAAEENNPDADNVMNETHLNNTRTRITEELATSSEILTDSDLKLGPRLDHFNPDVIPSGCEKEGTEFARLRNVEATKYMDLDRRGISIGTIPEVFQMTKIPPSYCYLGPKKPNGPHVRRNSMSLGPGSVGSIASLSTTGVVFDRNPNLRSEGVYSLPYDASMVSMKSLDCLKETQRSKVFSDVLKELNQISMKK